jgi:hypothetical protein
MGIAVNPKGRETDNRYFSSPLSPSLMPSVVGDFRETGPIRNTVGASRIGGDIRRLGVIYVKPADHPMGFCAARLLLHGYGAYLVIEAEHPFAFGIDAPVR